MQRLIWPALLCLVASGGLFAVRSVVRLTAVVRAAPPAITANVINEATPPLAKGDRLPSRFFDKAAPRTDSAAPRTIVDTVKIVPVNAPTQPEAPKDDVVSWHWHEGSKIVRRRAR